MKGNIMAKKKKETPQQEAKIKKVMEEYKDGELKSSSGQKVTNEKQAIAIALSEAGVPKNKKKK